MENMSWEILEAIIDTYNDGTKSSIEILVECYRYLYFTTTDEKMKEGCINNLSDLNYCLECGDKMTPYEWTDDNGDTHTTYDCLRCSDREVE